MGSQEERDNFFSLTLLLYRVGNQRLREYFKTQWPIVYQRARPGTVPPPWQDTPQDATEMKKIQPTELTFNFKDEETKFNSGNTNDWDFSLLTSVLKKSSLNFVLPSSPESNALDNLKAIRNKQIAHATDAAIPNAVFSSAWTNACSALALFNATAADFKSVQDDMKKPPDVLYPILIQCAAHEKLDIRHFVETTNDRLKQFEQTAEQQHAALQQTMEKQTTLQETVEQQHERVKRIERLVSNQGQQGQTKSSAEHPTDSKKLKDAVKSNTEYQAKLMADEDVTSARTDDIFTNLTVYYANKKPVKEEQEKGLGRKEHLQEYTKRKTGVKVDKCEDIFIGMEGENRNLRLTGKPGIGKTFFCEKVMRDWSMNRLFQNEDTPNINFAYLLKFRQLSKHGDKEINLRELLNYSPLLDDNSIIDESLFEYLIENSSEVLIILDGFDEYSEQHRRQIAMSDFEEKYQNDSRAKMPIPILCSKVIRGKLFKNSVVLVSSRPGEAQELGKINFDRYVEISGFSPEQVTEYVEKYFSEPEKEQTRNTVREHIEKNENLVSFCHIPLLSFLLCWCLEWRISQSGITENLPAKITDLYDEIAKVVVQKLHANLKYLEMSEDTMKRAQDTLDKLEKLAASLLQEHKYIFDEEDMKKQLTEDEIKNLKKSGILHFFSKIRISAFRTKSEYSFIHLTLHEYLSASFFVKNNEIPEKEKATGQTFIFMSGLCSIEKDGKLLMERIIEQVTPAIYSDKLQLLQCLYEYGDDVLTTETINNQYGIYCRYGNGFDGVSDIDVKCLSYFLDIIGLLEQQHPQLRIGDSSLTSFCARVVCDSLARNSFITELMLESCSLDDKCVEKMADSLGKTEVNSLKLSNNNITNQGVNSICSVLTKAQKVTHLSLGGNTTTDEQVDIICKVLPGTQITRLSLSSFMITDKAVESICRVLTETKITHLSLSDNRITDKGAENICSVIIQGACPVKRLDLWNEKITEECKKHLNELVHQHKPDVELVI